MQANYSFAQYSDDHDLRRNKWEVDFFKNSEVHGFGDGFKQVIEWNI